MQTLATKTQFPAACCPPCPGAKEKGAEKRLKETLEPRSLGPPLSLPRGTMERNGLFLSLAQHAVAPAPQPALTAAAALRSLSLSFQGEQKHYSKKAEDKKNRDWDWPRRRRRRRRRVHLKTAERTKHPWFHIQIAVSIIVAQRLRYFPWAAV